MVQPPFKIFLVPTWLRVPIWSGTSVFVCAVRVLVCAVSFRLCCESFGLSCESFRLCCEHLVCAVGYLILLWGFCYRCNQFVIAVTVVGHRTYSYHYGTLYFLYQLRSVV